MILNSAEQYTFQPAHQGWFVLEPIHGDGEEIIEFQKEPILSWLMRIS